MGGLVARKMIENYYFSSFIKTITTISTPHHGSQLANFVLNNFHKSSIVGNFIRLIDFVPQKRKYLSQLKIEDGINIYSSKLSNPRRIQIYSISNYKTNFYNAPLSVSQKYIDEKNDGIIETSSMIFGKHLGTVKADHMESGCVLYTRNSRGCRESLRMLLTHLDSLKIK